jgi:hypothetical protein
MFHVSVADVPPARLAVSIFWNVKELLVRGVYLAAKLLQQQEPRRCL